MTQQQVIKYVKETQRLLPVLQADVKLFTPSVQDSIYNVYISDIDYAIDVIIQLEDRIKLTQKFLSKILKQANDADDFVYILNHFNLGDRHIQLAILSSHEIIKKIPRRIFEDSERLTNFIIKISKDRVRTFELFMQRIGIYYFNTQLNTKAVKFKPQNVYLINKEDFQSILIAISLKPQVITRLIKNGVFYYHMEYLFQAVINTPQCFKYIPFNDYHFKEEDKQELVKLHNDVINSQYNRMGQLRGNQEDV